MQYGVVAEADFVINIALGKSNELTLKEYFTAGRDLKNWQIRYLRVQSKCVYVG